MPAHPIRAGTGLALLAAALAVGGCAHAPRASIEVSQGIGGGIAESRRSYTGLLNAYCDAKRSEIDRWIAAEYTPTLFHNIQASLKAAGKPEQLTIEEMAKTTQVVIDKRDEMVADLERTRVLLLTRSDEHFANLAQANTAITALLQSLVDADEATAAAAKAVADATGTKLDLVELEARFHDYLTRAGDAAAKGSSLYESVKQRLDSLGAKP